MWVIFIPIFLIAIAFVGVLNSLLDINITPIFIGLAVTFGLMSIFNIMRDKDEDKTPHIIILIISIITFIASCSASPTDTGDIISWIWYHI